MAFAAQQAVNKKTSKRVPFCIWYSATIDCNRQHWDGGVRSQAHCVVAIVVGPLSSLNLLLQLLKLLRMFQHLLSEGFVRRMENHRFRGSAHIIALVAWHLDTILVPSRGIHFEHSIQMSLKVPHGFGGRAESLTLHHTLQSRPCAPPAQNTDLLCTQSCRKVQTQ
jgi:hypothetical protein